MVDNVVHTRQGAVRGAFANGVYSFKGIPYAAPPFGPNHFRAPQPPEPWEGVRDALEYGPTPPKLPYPAPMDKVIPEIIIPGDDCLNLNIWTPDLGASGLPVMVWIYGGGFSNGTAAVPVYDGSNFARDGVIFVNLNYRIGVEGFMLVEGAPANRGILDQIAALEWVRDNIAAFGGDPAKVTIFGESAGAFSVLTLMSMERTRGLFHRAISESGAGHHYFSREAAGRVLAHIAGKLGVAPTLEGLAGVPVDKILQAQGETMAENRANPKLLNVGNWAFLPCVDGEVITEMPYKRLLAGAGSEVDLLIGSNSEEWRLYTVPAKLIGQITEQMLENAILATGMPLEETLALYRTVYPEATPGELHALYMTHQFFWFPCILATEAHTKGAAGTYLYEFAWQSPAYDGTLGAAHATEIVFAFDNLHLGGESTIEAKGGPQPLADAMHRSWVAFAKEGDPGWPRFDLVRRPTMIFDIESTVVNDPHARIRSFWAARHSYPLF